MNMIPAIRLAQTRDIHFLADIDLKSYDYPWTIDKWRKIAANPTCVIPLASIKVEPVSVCVWQKKPAIKEAEILRFATKPAYRNYGIGSLLLHTIEAAAREIELQEITIVVPEIKCFPGHPDDVSQWLLKHGYRAVTPILKDYFYMYGNHCDGFKFVHSIGENHA